MKSLASVLKRFGTGAARASSWRPLVQLPHRRGLSSDAGTALSTLPTDTETLLAVLRQVAATGHLQADTRLRLKGGDPEELPSEENGEVKCSGWDLNWVIDICRQRGIRDVVLLGQLADRLVEHPDMPELGYPDLVNLAANISILGVLHPPLFMAMTKSLLQKLQEPTGDSVQQMSGPEMTRLAKACASQRFRHEELFGRMAAVLRQLKSSLGSHEALTLLHAHAFLRLGPPHGELDEEMWQGLEDLVTSKDMDPKASMTLCYVLFVARRVNDSSLSKVVDLLSDGARKLQKEQSPLGPGLRRKVLLLRSAMRYLHPEVYKELPDDVLKLFRRVHRMDAPLDLKPSRLFVRKLSHVLTKLKIGHMIDADRGPFTFDIVERDRKVVYECNHFDRHYAFSTEKIASMCLQERIVKAMGYRVVQVPHWHWNKIRHRKQRIEYIRMSRYYALKDRREMVPRDEELQDVAVNELDFLGEYFFRKDMPQTHFAWFQPRYDAKLRIPQTSEAKEKPAEGTL